MALKVKAVEKLLKFNKDENDPGVYRYVMAPELYTSLNQKKVIKEAALRSGVSQGVMQACWDAAGEVIKAWATEGHSVAIPGLGTMRFGLRAKAVEDVNDVKSKLIKTRRIIFTPDVDLKEELASTAIQITCFDRNGKEVKRVIKTRRIIFTPDVDLKEELASTAIQITCYDRNGNEVKRVTSTDGGEVEDNDTNSTENGSTEQGGSTQQSTETPGGNTGGNGGGNDDPDDSVIS